MKKLLALLLAAMLLLSLAACNKSESVDSKTEYEDAVGDTTTLAPSQSVDTTTGAADTTTDTATDTTGDTATDTTGDGSVTTLPSTTASDTLSSTTASSVGQTSVTKPVSSTASSSTTASTAKVTQATVGPKPDFAVRPTFTTASTTTTRPTTTTTHGHAYTQTVQTPATYESEGSALFSCACGHSYVAAIPKLVPTKLDGGKCGATLNWELLSDGTLHIFGTGAMYDYVKFTKASPWYKYRDEPNVSADGKTIYDPDGSVYMKDSSYLKNNPNGYKIKRFKIDPGVTYIGDWAFYRVCVEELVIPEGVTETGIFCVRYSPTLKKLTLPNSLKILDDFGVSRNLELTTLNIGNGLQKIGTAGLRANPKLTAVRLPQSCTSINKQLSPAYTGAVIDYSAVGLMEECNSLQYVDFGRVTEIPQRTCMATAIEQVVIPNTVKKIGTYAFYQCTKLKTVEFEDGSACKTIHNTAFNACSSLVSVRGGTALESLGGYSGLKKLEFFEFSDANTTLQSNQFYKVALKEARVGANVKKIPSGWMAYSTSLERLYISASVTAIDANAFLSCTALTDIYYDGTRAQWDTITKASGWCSSVPSSCMVHFSDGTSARLSKCK